MKCFEIDGSDFIRGFFLRDMYSDPHVEVGYAEIIRGPNGSQRLIHGERIEVSKDLVAVVAKQIKERKFDLSSRIVSADLIKREDGKYVLVPEVNECDDRYLLLYGVCDRSNMPWDFRISNPPLEKQEKEKAKSQSAKSIVTGENTDDSELAEKVEIDPKQSKLLIRHDLDWRGEFHTTGLYFLHQCRDNDRIEIFRHYHERVTIDGKPTFNCRLRIMEFLSMNIWYGRCFVTQHLIESRYQNWRS